MRPTPVAVSSERRGAGTPVVLVHGLGSRWQVWSPILDRIADAGLQVIAVDLPGFGGTAPVDGVTPGPPGYVAWLQEWLAAEGIERPHLVGNSMGGGIALELGRAGVAASVTAFSPIGFWQRPGLWWTQALLTTLRAAGAVAGPPFSAALGTRLGRAVLLGPLFGRPTRVDPAEARADLAALVAAPAFPQARNNFADYHLSAADAPGALAAIPVTVAWGTRDVVLTHRTQSRRARAALPTARHIDLAGCGHLPFNDDPDLCARVVLDTVNEECPWS
ncbi:alpha/beta fold hydrolase [Nocardioides limicola]|uniref:alpha/beta fold hydrolase n=1 Tax=Nocardioides limicola TaxID=2803368 RepID=UPI00193C5531|nr:alpha/beta hydrolase [Nocardioides sp. DJM-14]